MTRPLVYPRREIAFLLRSDSTNSFANLLTEINIPEQLKESRQHLL